jgi:Tol biopolymer transport system component
MLTGERLFRGETASDILAAVLTRELDLGALPDDAPASVRTLLRRCLERDPRQRLRDIGEARISLERIAAGEEPTVSGGVVPDPGAAPDPSEPAPAGRPSRLPWVVAAAAALAALALGALAFLRPAPPEQSLVFELAPPPDTRFLIGANIGHGYLSPDGSKVAFLARGAQGRALWVRTLATGELRELPGTTEAFYPFWSPDGRELAFFSGTQLLSVDVAGGLPEALADVPQGRGGSWSESGEILLTPEGGGTLHRLPSGGGDLELITEVDTARGENAHYWPRWLPGGEHFLYFVRSAQSENNGIYLGSVEGEPPVRLVTTRSSGIYAPPRNGGPGHLLWVRDGELLAQPLDVEGRRLVGEVSVIASDVRVDEAQRQLLASVSADGTLVWASDSAIEFGLALYDRQGRRLERLPIPPGQALEPRFSPDARQLLHTRVEGGTADIWLFDFDSGRTTQVTTDASFDELGIWMPDGGSIVYRGEDALTRKFLGGETIVLVEDNQDIPSSFTPDGRFLIIDQQGSDGDFGYVDLAAPGQVQTLVAIPGREGDAAVSPDGRWMAFAHQVGDRPEVVVAPLLREGDSLGVGRPWLPVSNRGGIVPHWQADGRELIYVSTEGALQAVAVTPSGSTLRLGTPEELFFLEADSGGWRFGWGASPDHERFVLFEEFGADRQTLHVLTNWQSRLEG